MLESLLLLLLAVGPAPAERSAPGDSAPARGAAARAPDKVRPVFVDKGRLRVPSRKGGFVADAKLVGALLVGRDDAGRPSRHRVDSVFAPADSAGLWMYAFSSEDPATGKWFNSCAPDAKGLRRGFALPGYFDARGTYVADSAAYTITCTSGASGKCVLYGYLPWGRAADGTPLRPYYQACARLIRADYCGNGRSHTRTGTWIEIWDHKGVMRDVGEPGYSFEASWGPEGAVWLRRTRLPDLATLEDIAKECPEKYVRMKAESDTSPLGPALLFNNSK